MKKRILLIVCLCMALGFAGCGFVNREAQKATVFRMVEENYALLMEDISIGDFARSEAIEGIESVRANRGLDGWTVEYDCGGAGFGPSTSYWGFYYSKNTDLDRMVHDGQTMAPDGNGFLYEQENGDNRFYVEHITGDFYYYFESF